MSNKVSKRPHRQHNVLVVNSCTNSSIMMGGFVFACGGVYSCSNSITSPTTAVFVAGLGAYSLSNSTIYGPNNTETNMHITLQGYYSGYNLIIFCYQNDICNVTCFGNSCFNTFVYCDGICSVECDNRNQNFCAQTLSPNESISIEDIEVIIDASGLFAPYLDQIGLENERRCNNYKNETTRSIVFNSPAETNTTANINITFTDENGNICCRGSQACYKKDVIAIDHKGNGTKINDIICSGYESCKDTSLMKLDRFSNIYCTAVASCQNTVMVAKHNSNHVYLSYEL